MNLVELYGFNPITEQPEKALRRRLNVNYELPLREEYAQMITALLSEKRLDGENIEQ